MVSIYMNGKDKTKQISDWHINYDHKYKILKLTCHFPSGKSFSLPLSKCKIVPTELIQGNLLTREGQPTVTTIEKAEMYGKKYTVIYYPNNKIDVMLSNKVEIKAGTNIKDNIIFNYFKTVIQARIEQSSEHDKHIAENILRQLDKITPHPDTALQAYCAAINKKRQPPHHFIYPFGINESQLKAVENAFTSQISIIEGPPGTGKTQTILNIVANILISNKTVAILSNNNSAVENVYEKLAKEDLDYLVAKLGNTDKRNDFFNSVLNINKKPQEHTIKLKTISNLVNTLKSHLHAQNQVALLQAQIDELTIEKSYLQQWLSIHTKTEQQFLQKHPIVPKKIADLLAYLHYLAQKPVTFKDRIYLLLNFRIIRTSFINSWEKRKALFNTLQFAYYEQQLGEKRKLLAKYQQILQENQFKHLLTNLTDFSMKYLKIHLTQVINNPSKFTVHDYQQHLAEFTKRFPIIGSSSHSIINSIGAGTLLDYLIIDEASQQDIIPGILGLGCTKNVIIVGDRKQLPHVPINISITPPIAYYDCEKYSLLDSFIHLFKDKIPITLLKEHYRCHPKIIQFCNKQFYDNQLIPMTQDKGEDALILITTTAGNHARNFSNLRELDSFNQVGWQNLDENNTGFIAPYNSQIDLSKKHLPEGVIKATAHKFQGRECDNIIFSTVLDKKLSNQKNLAFVDDPNLINVAVSRAKNKFVLVTGNDVFTQNNQSIAALVRYIKYYADNTQIYDSPVISAFDLLYQEYDKSLEVLNSRLNSKDSKFKSEQIIAQLLRQILMEETYHTILFHREIRLNQLVSIQNQTFTQREQEFIHNRACCDFVLYFKTGKNPLGVIEVDGHYHEKASQKERDKLKNIILAKAGLPLLRLKTIESQIEDKIRQFLTGCIYKKEN